MTEFLRSVGAMKTGHHAGRSLHDHLLATYRLLLGWRLDESVAVGGLFHSVYGTDVFETACLGPGDREKVRTCIGANAEHLAYCFGAMRREEFENDPVGSRPTDRFTGDAMHLATSVRVALAHILLANEIDLVIAKKGAGRPDKVIKKVGPLERKLQPLLCQAARDHYLRIADQGDSRKI